MVVMPKMLIRGRLKILKRYQLFYGAQGRNRTTDTAIFSRMLYQLSYLGMPRAVV
jgi:hypothetical protein